MPINPRDLLDLFGIRMPQAPSVTPEQEKLRDVLAEREQAKASPLRKAGQTMIMAPGEFVSGLFADPAGEDFQQGATAKKLGTLASVAPLGIPGLFSRAEKLAASLPASPPN